METRIIGQGEEAVCVVEAEGVLIASAQDMLDLIATQRYEHGCSRLVLKKENIAEAFFDLRTGLAGEVLQKVINYHAALAIVGDYSGYTSKALRDFIYESNQGTRIFFVPTEAEAVQWLQTRAIL